MPVAVRSEDVLFAVTQPEHKDRWSLYGVWELGEWELGGREAHILTRACVGREPAGCVASCRCVGGGKAAILCSSLSGSHR
eukprot:scaffold9245_cov78-Phaeocystis_antarctica.AAC.2